MDILVLIVIIAFIVWLICQFVPAPGWLSKAALIVTLGCLVMLAAGVRLIAD